MDGEMQTTQTNQPSGKKNFWQYVSPKTTFISGLVLGVAVFAGLNMIYSFLALNRINTNQNVAANTDQEEPIQQNEPAGTPAGSFVDTGKTLCKENGKPVVRLFTTTWCPHCQWIAKTFDKVVNEYVAKGKITAYHWELDTFDNMLTKEVEKAVPASEEAVYNEFNPNGSIPTFVFGCRYYRIGNAFETEGDAGLVKEEQEFRDLIDKMLTEK
jgi:thiol-disulfide isomerase/thioredoxin